LRNSVLAATKLLKGDGKDPRAAVSLMFDQCVEMLRTEKSANLFDFRDSLKPVMAEHTAKQMGTDIGIDLGWPTLDAMIGGIRKDDLVSYVGRPQKGKTYMMLYSALHAWEKQSKTIMFCTFEMEGRLIRERLASMYAHVPNMNLKLGELTTHDRKQMITKLTNAKDMKNPLWILDAGMATTVPELLAVMRSLKPDVVYLDGAYLIQHENTRLDRFRKIDAVADLIKTVLCPLAPCVASWQYNRAASKKKKDDPVTADDVYGSDVIFMVSSILLGIFQAETPETVHRKLVQIQKGRGGEKGEFTTNWDFKKMDFSEYFDEDGDDDLSYV
jgi:replicative DNA helicase